MTKKKDCGPPKGERLTKKFVEEFLAKWDWLGRQALANPPPDPRQQTALKLALQGAGNLMNDLFNCSQVLGTIQECPVCKKRFRQFSPMGPHCSVECWQVGLEEASRAAMKKVAEEAPRVIVPECKVTLK